MTTAASGRHLAGWIGAVVILLVYGGIALAIDYPQTARTIWSDESTYMLMGQSLVRDGDLEYRQEDLERAMAEWPGFGPNGIFLKRGSQVTGVTVLSGMPFVEFGPPDDNPSRLYYGKAYIYPLVATPLVAAFGTGGFLLLNAMLLAVAFLAAFYFLSARSPVIVSALLAGGFIFASVVPVYFAWLQPEVFNFTLGLLAYFCWLYKFVAPDDERRRRSWLHGRGSDVAAAVLVGVVTFSKVTNALLMVPIGLWWLWKADWRRLIAVCATWAVVTVGLFAGNVAVSGEWNYQGGDRRTCNGAYPFATPASTLEVCDERGRDGVQGNILFDPEVFWSNLRANLGYFVVGRNSGLIAYFFPAVFGALALMVAGRRGESWQWLVLAGLVLQILVFVISLPYTYFGGGGSVGNRYFVGAYGMCLFLLPPIRSRWVAAVPLAAGAIFMAPLVLHPFATSQSMASHSQTVPLRWLPVEMTNILDLPLLNEPDRSRQPFGDNPGVGDYPFQLFFLDDEAYGKESLRDASFWLKGETRAEFLVRVDTPVRWLRYQLRAGAVDTTVTARVGDKAVAVDIAANGRADIVIALPPGFPNKHARPVETPGPTYIWTVSLASSAGFRPADVEPGSTDTRFLGVHVRPMVFR